jgi:hypothetical protein
MGYYMGDGRFIQYGTELTVFCTVGQYEVKYIPGTGYPDLTSQFPISPPLSPLYPLPFTLPPHSQLF